MTATRIRVGGEHPHEIVVGADIQAELPALVGTDVRTVVVVHVGRLSATARVVCEVLAAAGYIVRSEAVPDGEAAKDVSVAAWIWSRLAAAGVGRNDAIVAVGGGAVTDLAGFVAATWLRGIRIVLVPTTLLGMADAAIGGKTAINTTAGKNLVGAFHPPAGVLVDISTLATLPVPEYVSGLAEVIKAGFIADPVILDLIESEPAAAAKPGGSHERELIERAIKIKAAVVSADLREAGPREMLNYGHTLGHAIERVEDYSIRHGEAVAIGMCFAAAVGRLAGRLNDVTAARHWQVLSAVGLPTSYRGASWTELREVMALDKKTRAARLRMVVLDGLAKPGILTDPEPELLTRAFAEVS